MVALGNGDGTFAKPITVLSAGIMNQSIVGFRFVLVGDLDADHRPDVAVDVPPAVVTLVNIAVSPPPDFQAFLLRCLRPPQSLRKFHHVHCDLNVRQVDSMEPLRSRAMAHQHCQPAPCRPIRFRSLGQPDDSYCDCDHDCSF